MSKIRAGFVTNSSSSSFIVCFARIADKEKAQKIIDEYKKNVDLEIYSGSECLKEMENRRWSKWLEWDWAGIDATPSTDYINEYIDDDFIVITDYSDIEDPEWEGEYDWDENYHDPKVLDAISEIIEENGFADIDCQYGAGRDG